MGAPEACPQTSGFGHLGTLNHWENSFLKRQLPRCASLLVAWVMDKTDVLNLLEENQNEKGIQNWETMEPSQERLKSFGIGLTVLRKLAKTIGKDRVLALQLWDTELYDAKIIALLIDDPKQMTRVQAERQVEEVAQGYLAHVFSTCGATLAKTPFVVELTDEWIHSPDPIRRSCGYGLLYEVSKKKRGPDDAFFLNCIQHIQATIADEEPSNQLAMAASLMGIGKRNIRLHGVALALAKKIGPIEVTSGRGKCDPFDVVKHLTSDYAKKKFGIS